MSPRSAATVCAEANAASRTADWRRAMALFDKAVAAAPTDAAVLSSAGTFYSKHGNTLAAIALFERAVAAAPGHTDALINLAILLTGSGQARRAIDLLVPQEAELGTLPRYWSVRANAERSAGKKRAALLSYGKATSLPGAAPRVWEGLARVSLETGNDAREHYRAAMRQTGNTPSAVLGYSQALEAEGQAQDARTVAEQLVQQLPGWTDGLEWLAQLRWAADEQEHFADHYEGAVRSAAAPHVFFSWCRMLHGVDRFAEAAAVAARAQGIVADPTPFLLLEAAYTSEAGDDARVAAIYAQLQLQSPDRCLFEARHALRIGQPDRAEALITRSLAERPDDVGAWALRDLAWRILDDPRHEWLHGQTGLVQPLSLELDNRQLAMLTRFLDALHERSAAPIGQSVRRGTQTRGGLFDRHDPEVSLIEQRFEAAVQRYRANLPSADDSHPLLRHRATSWRFAGSWSIRVSKGGRHREHIHPKGLVSSAAYIVVPVAAPGDDPQAGWLELGRPPPDLRLNLPPVASFQPRPGVCVLFPSTLFHGTRPFADGKRMTVAVDVQKAAG